MKFKTTFSLAWRNLARNKRRTFLSALSVAVAGLSLSFLFAMSDGMMNDYRQNVRRFVTGDVRLRHPEYDSNEIKQPLHLNMGRLEELVPLLESIKGVTGVFPRLNFGGRVDREDKSYNVLGLGLDFEREAGLLKPESYLREGRLPDPEAREALLGAALAAELGVGVGDKLTILTRTRGRGMNAMTFTITGTAVLPLLEQNKRMVIVPLAAAQRMIRMPDAAQEVLVGTRRPDEAAVVAAEISEALEKAGFSASVLPWEKIGLVALFTQMTEVMYAIIALVFFVLGSAIIINTTMMVIYERYHEIGTLSALGATGGSIVFVFFIEATLIALLGSLGGVGLGNGLAGIFSLVGMDFSTMMEGISLEFSPVIYPQITLRSTVGTFLFGVIVGSVMSYFPSRKAAKIVPVDALRSI